MRRRKLILGLCIFALAVTFSASSAEAGFFRNFFKRFRQPLPNIAEFVIDQNSKTGEFSTLLSALTTVSADPNQPDLVSALMTEHLTVFAPTDEAFSNINLDPNSVAMLPTDALANILLYHVTGGKRRALSLLLEGEVEMLNGDSVDVDLNFWPFGVYVNDSKVINANLKASNGFIHVIDEVLMPPVPEPPKTYITNNIPEPTSLALCMGCSAMLLVRRRLS